MFRLQPVSELKKQQTYPRTHGNLFPHHMPHAPQKNRALLMFLKIVYRTKTRSLFDALLVPSRFYDGFLVSSPLLEAKGKTHARNRDKRFDIQSLAKRNE